MNLEIKSILEKIEDNGFEAYVVGGYVRDYLLGIHSVDVDICTNALPKDVINIFNIKKETIAYGSVTISSGIYNIDITTYRTEDDYLKHHPKKVKYTNNLITDIQRRDFTINTLCMNKDGYIFDYLDGQKDLNNRLIKVVGCSKDKLTEDPLRILRALRFSIILDFDLDEEILSFIQNNKDLIKNLSYTRKKEELDKILSSKNMVKGLKLLKDLDLLWALEIDYDKMIEVQDLLGIWAQIIFSENYPFTKNNLNIIKKIRNILTTGEINNYTLFKEGLYISSVAGEILGMNKKYLNHQYQNLVIKSTKELKINNQDIMDILNIKPSSKLKIIYDDVLKKVLDKKIRNDYESIKEYIITNWK